MITIQQVFADVNGATFIGLDTLTQVKLLGGKANPLQGRVTKLHEGANVMVFQNNHGSSYGAMVQRRLVKEGKNPSDFQLQPRKWGTRQVGTPFVEYEDKLYLEVIFLRAGKSMLLVDGEPHLGAIDGLPPQREEAEQGGLDDKVIIRTFKVESLVRVRIDGQEIAFRR